MGSARIARASIKKIGERIKIATERKKYFEIYLKKLKESYSSGKISYNFYIETLHNHRDGKSIIEWIHYYNHYIKECEDLLKKHQKDVVKRHLAILFFSAAVIFFILISISNFKFFFTGLITQEPISEIISEANATTTTTQHQAILGQPVKWTKTISLDKPATTKIRLSTEAVNISVSKIPYSEENS